jgi:multidrug efflux pump subunit AcrB
MISWPGAPRIETFGEERLVMFMATLSSKTHSPRQLEKVAGEICARLESVPGVRSITRHGGDKIRAGSVCGKL